MAVHLEMEDGSTNITHTIICWLVFHLPPPICPFILKSFLELHIALFM